jgi:ABC-type Mn2+/Zn2+ transport system ATPase subunit
MDIAIRFRDLTLGYDRHPAVHHLDGEVESGALLAVCGPNGAGKSTLLKGIAGTLAPLAGSIALPRLKSRDIAYLPQAADIDKSFPINVFDVAAMGLWKRCGLFGGISRSETAKIRAAIAAVGLDGFEARAIATLSGGQLQRMLFARLLVQDAAVILLDEPLPRSTPKPSPILFPSCRRGTRTIAPCSPSCTISISCVNISRKPSCSRGKQSPREKPMPSLPRKICLKRGP